VASTGTDHLGIALDDVALENLAVGSPDHFSFLGARQAGPHHEALGPSGGQGIDRRQLEALVHRTAQPLAGGGGGHLQFLEQDVEAVDHQLAGFRLFAEQTRGRGTHLLQGHVGGGQGAGLLEHIPQAAGIDGKDARVAGHHRIAHVAQEPGHVPEGLAHPIRAIDTHGDGVETAGQHHPHIGIGLDSLEHPSQQTLATGTLHEGLDRGAEGLLVGGQGNRFLLGSRQGSVEIGERGAADEDPVRGAGHDRSGVGGDAPGGLNAGLAALEKGDQRIEFAAIRKTILLFSPSNAGERQGVVELGSDPGAAAAGGHGHERERAWLGHVTAGPLLSRHP
jgi:hypothetical protein